MKLENIGMKIQTNLGSIDVSELDSVAVFTLGVLAEDDNRRSIAHSTLKHHLDSEKIGEGL